MTVRRYPPRMRPKKGRLYHVFDGKWTPLGPDGDPVPADVMERYDDLERSVVSPDMLTVAGLMATFRAQLVAGTLKKRDGKPIAERTRDEYQRILKPSGRLARVFGHMRLDQIRPRHIGEYLERHPRPIMANREIALLSRMFTYAIRRGGFDGFNPCRHIEKNPPNRRTRYVEHWEYAAVFRCATVQQQIFMAVTYLSNLRESTVLAIRLADWDRKAGIIKVLEKGDKPARLVVTPKLEEVIAWHTAQPGHDRVDRALIRAERQGEKQKALGGGYTADGWRANWRRLMAGCIAAGVLKEPFTCHDLRAKHATDRAEARFDTQLALGHFDQATTAAYIRHPLGRKIYPLDDLPETDDDAADNL